MAQERGQDQDAAQDLCARRRGAQRACRHRPARREPQAAQLSEGYVRHLRHRRQLHGQHGGDRGEGGRARPRAHASDEEEQGLCAPVDVRPLVQDGQAVRCRLRLRCRQPRAPAVPHGDEQPALQGRQGHPGLHGREEPVRHLGLWHVCHRVLGHLLHLASRKVEHRPLGLPRRHGHVLCF